MNAPDRVGVSSLQRSLRPGNLCPVSSQSASSLATALSPVSPAARGCSPSSSAATSRLRTRRSPPTLGSSFGTRWQHSSQVCDVSPQLTFWLNIKSKITSSHQCIHTTIYNYLYLEYLFSIILVYAVCCIYEHKLTEQHQTSIPQHNIISKHVVRTCIHSLLHLNIHGQ